MCELSVCMNRSTQIHLCMCECECTRFFGISTVVAVHDFFVFFFFRSAAYYGNIFLLLLSVPVPVLHTTFLWVCFCFPTARNIVFIHCVCVPFAIVFFSSRGCLLVFSSLVRMIAIKFCARVCAEFTKKRMFYDFSAVFHPMCILWYHSSYFRTASLSKRANTRTQSLTISIGNITQTHLCTFNAALFAMKQMQTHFWHGTFNNGYVQYCLLLFLLLEKNFYSCYFGACFLSVRHLKNN